MINIISLELNVAMLIATAYIRIDGKDACILSIKLASINITNYDDTVNLVESLDWSNAIPGKAYHLELGVLTETPSSPGSTYVFNYSTFSWEDTRTIKEMWITVKSTRNDLLSLSDWTQMPDVSLTTKSAWAVYRQQLRDITTQADPFNIVWPTAPGG